MGSPALRIAFVGKGGVGKSTVAGTLARVLGQRGHEVLALDSDPMPGLALSLGIDASDAGIPDEAVVEQAAGTPGPQYLLRPDLTADEAVARYAQPAPDGVRFLQFGKLRDGVGPFARSQHAFRQVVQHLPPDRWSVIGDLPGGTRQPFLGWSDFARTVVVVVEPTAASLLTGRRLARLGQRADRPDVVAVVNKARDAHAASSVSSRTGLVVAAVIPADPEAEEAERRGSAPVDGAPGSALVRAVGLLADRLTEGGPV
jgi:CO dehydrogenase maturation factor